MSNLTSSFSNYKKPELMTLTEYMKKYSNPIDTNIFVQYYYESLDKCGHDIAMKNTLELINKMKYDSFMNSIDSYCDYHNGKTSFSLYIHEMIHQIVL